MASFEPAAGGLRAHFDRGEAAVLRDLAEQMEAMLGEPATSDPVMTRLFPDAYEAKSDADKWRELTRTELQSEKENTLKEFRRALGGKGEVDLTLAPSQAEAWLRVLTDLRLAIGTRLDVTEEKMSQEIDEDVPDAAAMSVLHWLGWVQESMLEVMSEERQGG